MLIRESGENRPTANHSGHSFNMNSGEEIKDIQIYSNKWWIYNSWDRKNSSLNLWITVHLDDTQDNCLLPDFGFLPRSFWSSWCLAQNYWLVKTFWMLQTFVWLFKKWNLPTTNAWIHRCQDIQHWGVRQKHTEWLKNT